MKKATPKEKVNVLTPKNKTERVEALNKLDKSLGGGFLKKTYLFLSQLQRAGIGIYKIKENEIKGLTNDDITTMLFSINPIYGGFDFNIDDKRFIEKREKYVVGGKLKEKVFVNGNIIDYPVFCNDGLDLSDEKYAERTFKIGQQFELALGEIKEILYKNNFYLILDNNIFLYNGDYIKIKPNTLLYDILRNVYDYFDGKKGKVLYKDLFIELRKIKKLKSKSQKDIKLKIRQNLTSEKVGLGKKIDVVTENGRKLFETRDGKELLFNNEKISE